MAIASPRLSLSSFPDNLFSFSNNLFSFPNTSILKPRPFAPIKIKSVPYPPRSANPNLSGSLSIDKGGNNDNVGGGGLGKGGGGSGGHDGNSSSGGGGGLDPMAALMEGYRSRVAADPEFPLKVTMEELVGVAAAAAADMATRPNFGLDELGSVFSTLVVSSLGSFTLLNLLAPTLTLTSSSTSLPSYIFEPGPFPLSARLARLFYKGLIFAAVGFASGLAGTAISNGLVTMRRKKEKDAKKKKKKGLNAAVHVGVSSNLRYRTLDAVVEFLMARAMPAGVFKGTVVVLRCLNNAAGGFASGLAGTAISYGLLAMRKKEKDAKEKKKKKKGLKTVLNAAMWAVHVGVSSNLRYQTLNAAVEFLMAKAMPVGVFKATVAVHAGIRLHTFGTSYALLMQERSCFY